MRLHLPHVSTTSPADADVAASRWRSAAMLVASIGLLAGLGAAVRVYLLRNGFSEDEFFQLTLINEPFPHFFVQFLRLDQHPAFHFLQLKLWELASSADGWMLANSLAWHLASCACIFFVARAWQGVTVGLLAAAMYSLLPQVVVGGAAMLRMYAMVPGLAVLCWWLNVQLLSGSKRGFWLWLALVLVQTAFGYSHAIAFFFNFWIAVAAAVQVAAEGPPRAAWRRWLAVQSGVAVLLLPLLVLAVARVTMVPTAGSGGNQDPGGLMDHFGGMVAGWGMDWAAARVAGAAFFSAAIAVGLWNRRTRWMSLGLLVGPYAAAVVVGMIMSPIFKTPLYSAMLTPFACLALAAGFNQSKLLRLPLLLVVVVMALCVVPATGHLSRNTSPYRDIAQELLKRVQPGDVVLVPKPYMYWATMRYTVGPHWGSALEVLPALNGGWLRVTQRLGPDLARAMKLLPRTQQLEHAGVTYVIGDDAVAPSATAHRVWLVQRPRYAEPVRLADGFVNQGVVVELGQPEKTQIILYQR